MMKKKDPGKKPVKKPVPGRKEQTPSPKPLAKGPSAIKPVIVVILACFIFYGNTLTLKYAYDDLMVITGNRIVKKGLSGLGEIFTTDLFAGYFGKDAAIVAGGRYRPLSLATFALEYQFFGENPMVSHLVNVLLFAAVCVMLLLLLQRLATAWKPKQDRAAWYFSAPLLIALLFAGHPVHTEVVANIKSRDEILALLFCLITLWVSMKFLEKRKAWLLLAGFLAFFLAMLSKENSATFLLIQPVTLFFFTRHKTKYNFIALIPAVIATFVFLLIRQSVVGHATSPLVNDLMNNPFVEMTLPQKYATILYTLGLYIKLLIFPHPLTCDYYPYHIPVISPGDWRAIVPLILYLAMIVFIILKTGRKNLVAYCLLFYLVTISVASNIVFPIGSFMNERFLFMPSIGFCILLGAGILWLVNRLPSGSTAKKPVLAGIMILVLSLYAVKTISRNADWYDSYTLFTHDVRVSANSAKANEVAGEYIMGKAGQEKNKAVKDSLLRLSISYQKKAIRVYPKQIVALINLAAAYYDYNRNYDTILVIYKTILGYVPGNPQIYTFFNTLMGKYDNVGHKIRLYSDLLGVNPERFDVNMNLGSLYLSGKQDARSALPYLEKAASLNPGDFDAQNMVATAYGYLGRWKEARIHFELADNIKPGDALLNKNLSVVYRNLGEQILAREAEARANTGK